MAPSFVFAFCRAQPPHLPQPATDFDEMDEIGPKHLEQRRLLRQGRKALPDVVREAPYAIDARLNFGRHVAVAQCCHRQPGLPRCLNDGFVVFEVMADEIPHARVDDDHSLGQARSGDCCDCSKVSDTTILPSAP